MGDDVVRGVVYQSVSERVCLSCIYMLMFEVSEDWLMLNPFLYKNANVVEEFAKWTILETRCAFGAE